MKITKEQSDIIVKNYPIHGSRLCSELTGLSLSQVRGKAANLNLKLLPKINMDKFINNITKEAAYILGYIWGDGYIGSQNRIGISTSGDDYISLEAILATTGEWKFYRYPVKNHPTWKDKLSFNISDEVLHKFLLDMNYSSKNQSPCKIIAYIPKEFRHYWFRGLIDADGCFYYNEKQCCKQFFIAGPVDQDWMYMYNLFNLLKIRNYNINLRNRPNSKASYFRTTNREDIIKLGEYIYQNYDEVGLRRKYNKYQDIKNAQTYRVYKRGMPKKKII
jgi:hypothetical protein